MEPSWLTFAAANGFGVHRIRFGILSGILGINQIPRARGTVSLVPADGFCWILSHAGLVEDTAQPIACARPPLPHQIEFILAKLTLRRMTHSKRGSVAKPVESGRSLSPNSPRPISYVAALLSPRGGGLRAVVDSFSVDTG
jgi:hypothetical protein